MNQIRVLWTPYPYKAGFGITDDTDAASLTSVSLVYDFLKEINLRTTKTVWAFEPDEPSGIPATPDSTLRGVTLENREYFDYCKNLHEAGFEISLHGASAGNNRRERTQKALEIAQAQFGQTDTFICHSKNAENVYWEDKVTANPFFRRMLSLYSKHECSGETGNSPYFWGDLCRKYVKQIRLFRTRNTNTLKFNPSMPYYDPAKPLVQSWFSATKRSFHDCTSETALNRLQDENGLTQLYQYLHRYADLKNNSVDAQFAEDARRLTSNKHIWVETTSKILNRLRLMQSIFIAQRGDTLNIINSGGKRVEGVQIEVSLDVTVKQSEIEGVSLDNRILHIDSIQPNSVNSIRLSTKVSIAGNRQIELSWNGRGKLNFGTGTIYLNLSDSTWKTVGLEIPTNAYEIKFEESIPDWKPMSVCSGFESTKLLLGQMWIIAREMILRKRSLGTEFLDSEDIKLEDHSEW